mmetsp:Transcript_68511/g.155258  ORF Transcript_68511/g.155258 Transcript_68511/m.155258 type:complete len:186 (+) Transcript_68511:241-798(+)
MLNFEGDRKALWKECGCVSTGFPVLKHGKLAMCQSTTIQNYICAISPKFKTMPARARAIDAMYFAHVEDLLGDLGKTGLFGQLFGGPPAKTDELKAAVEKWCGHFEGQAPDSGFINGLEFPTGADSVILVLYKAAAHWKYLFELSGVEKEAYPKLARLSERAAAAPGIAEYVAKLSSLSMDPFEK